MLQICTSYWLIYIGDQYINTIHFFIIIIIIFFLSFIFFFVLFWFCFVWKDIENKTSLRPRRTHLEVFSLIVILVLFRISPWTTSKSKPNICKSEGALALTKIFLWPGCFHGSFLKKFKSGFLKKKLRRTTSDCWLIKFHT